MADPFRRGRAERASTPPTATRWGSWRWPAARSPSTPAITPPRSSSGGGSGSSGSSLLTQCLRFPTTERGRAFRSPRRSTSCLSSTGPPGSVRNSEVDNTSQQRDEPVLHRNFVAMAGTSPAIYQYLSTQSFFTSRTIRKDALLRSFPHISSLSGVRPNRASPIPGARWNTTTSGPSSRGASPAASRRRSLHAGLRVRAGFYDNEFDAAPAWRPADQVRPHRLVWSAIGEAPSQGQALDFLRAAPAHRPAAGS